MLPRPRKLTRALSHPTWRRALRRGVLAGSEHAQALGHLTFQTVVDVGAHCGQFALFARATWPEARIVALEPLPGPAARFRRLFADDAGVALHEVALAPQSGRRHMQVSARSDSSSLLPVGPAQTAAFPGTHAIGETAVATARLAEVVAADAIVPPALLKLDVQGFELWALQGVAELLRRFEAIYCECSLQELYLGQALLPDVSAYLQDRGFQERGRFNLAHHRRFGPVQADVLFMRRPGA